MFHKAICQSGTSLNPWATGRRNAEDTAKCMGYKDKDEKAVLEKLRKENQKNIVSGVFRTVDVSMIQPLPFLYNTSSKIC